MGYDPNEPRDESGRWTDAGGVSHPAPSSLPTREERRAALIAKHKAQRAAERKAKAIRARERAKATIRNAKKMAREDVKRLVKPKVKDDVRVALRRLDKADKHREGAEGFWQHYYDTADDKVRDHIYKQQDKGERYTRHIEAARRILDGRRTREDEEEDRAREARLRSART